ncbi:MAG: hypothetical protein N4A76_04970 [Firmicutes bacterium]|jgi:hypothetical protein|nr:hypothetical protein [Bacillota bacterium]
MSSNNQGDKAANQASSSNSNGNASGVGNGKAGSGYSNSGSSSPKEGFMEEVQSGDSLDMREITGKGEKNLTFTILNKVLNEEIQDYKSVIESISSAEIEKIEREKIPEEYKEHIKDYFNRIKE